MSSKVAPGESDDQPLLGEKSSRAKTCALVTCFLIVLGIVLAIIFVPNPSSSECGSTELPEHFTLHEAPLSFTSIRHNVDVLGVNDTKVGEYYRKLISRKRTFRQLDVDGHIGASMVRTSLDDGSEYVIKVCNKKVNDTYSIRQMSYLNADNTWDVQYTVSEKVGTEFKEVASTPRQPATSVQAVLTSSYNNNARVASIVRGGTEDEGTWDVSLHQKRLPAYVVGFFALSVTDTAHFINVDMSASPSPSPSITPSISPSRHAGSSSASAIMSFLSLAVASIAALLF